MNATGLAEFLNAQRDCRRILLVEDDDNDAFLTTRTLRPLNCEIVRASSAEEAIEALKEQSFHLALIDIRLPGMNGVELSRFISQNFDTQVTILSGSSDSPLVNEALRDGFILLPKPLTLDHVNRLSYGLCTSDTLFLAR